VQGVGSEVISADRADFSITAKPNCSLTPDQRLWVFAAIASFSLIVATGFTLAGAWMVFPFAGLELLALGFAFYVIHCHSGDYESITIAGDDLAVETRHYKNISRVVFHRYWARVVLRGTAGGEQRLWLRSHGREVEFGRYLNNDARLVLASQLKRRTGVIY
jgi:uncharacterized membrane protein